MSFAINRFTGFSAQSLSTAMNDVVEGIAASLQIKEINETKKSSDVFQSFDPGLTNLNKASGVGEVADFSTPTSYLPGGVSPEWDQVVGNLNSRNFDIGDSLGSFATSFDATKLHSVISDQQATELGKMNIKVNDFVDLYRQLGAAIGSFMWIGPVSD